MLNGTRTPRQSINDMLWGELTWPTRIRLLLTAIALPIFAGYYGLIEWSDTIGAPVAGYAGFVAGAAVALLIRPRKQAAR